MNETFSDRIILTGKEFESVEDLAQTLHTVLGRNTTDQLIAALQNLQVESETAATSHTSDTVGDVAQGESEDEVAPKERKLSRDEVAKHFFGLILWACKTITGGKSEGQVAVKDILAVAQRNNLTVPGAVLLSSARSLCYRVGSAQLARLEIGRGSGYHLNIDVDRVKQLLGAGSEVRSEEYERLETPYPEQTDDEKAALLLRLYGTVAIHDSYVPITELAELAAEWGQSHMAVEMQVRRTAYQLQEAMGVEVVHVEDGQVKIGSKAFFDLGVVGLQVE